MASSARFDLAQLFVRAGGGHRHRMLRLTALQIVHAHAGQGHRFNQLRTEKEQLNAAIHASGASGAGAGRASGVTRLFSQRGIVALRFKKPNQRLSTQ